jgi:hypothetical protein
MDHAAVNATVGEWTPLPGGGGSLLALAGPWTAAAELGRLTVWSAERLVAQVEPARPIPGRPQLTAHEVRWGGTVLSLETGETREVEGVDAALRAGLDLPVDPPPGGGGYAPAGSAWSPDGEVLIVSAAWHGFAGPPSARVALLDADDERQAILWEAGDLAPRALWAGPRFLIVGAREPRVYTRDGALYNVLDGRTPAARIETDLDERHILIAEHGRLTVWSTETWKPLARWEGGWLDAALAPSADLVVAVDLDGKLHTAALADGTPVPVPVKDPVQAVALGDDRIVACFARGAPIRTAPIHVA